MPPAIEQMNRGSASWWEGRDVWVAIGFSIVAPLSCFQSLDALKVTSSLSIVFVVFLTILIILYALGIPSLDPCSGASESDQCVGERVAATGNLDVLRVLSIFVFAFTCQQNTFSVVNELKRPTISRINSVFAASIGTAFVLYVLAASFGYFTYGDMVSSDLLKSYPENAVTSAARVFVSMIVAFHYPLQCNPARRSVLSLFKHLNHGIDVKPSVYLWQYWVTTVSPSLSPPRLAQLPRQFSLATVQLA
jgi:amino acid permease